jgi:hypothetical protein
MALKKASLYPLESYASNILAWSLWRSELFGPRGTRVRFEKNKTRSYGCGFPDGAWDVSDGAPDGAQLASTDGVVTVYWGPRRE